MTIEEYKQKTKDITGKAMREQDELIKEYVLSNNTIRKGSIITDHVGSIMFESIGWTLVRNVPTAIYIGTELRKDKKPRKKHSTRRVWGCNVINVDG